MKNAFNIVAIWLVLQSCTPTVNSERIIYPVHRLEEVNRNMKKFLQDGLSPPCHCPNYYDATGLLSVAMSDILMVSGGFSSTGELNNAMDLNRGNDIILSNSFQLDLLKVKKGFDYCIRLNEKQDCLESLQKAKESLEIFSDLLSESELKKSSIAEIYYWLAVTKNQLLFIAISCQLNELNKFR